MIKKLTSQQMDSRFRGNDKPLRLCCEIPSEVPHA
jgi:hypothetical protein